MSFLPRLRQLLQLPSSPRDEADEELRFHLEESVRELERAGLAPAAARAEAERRFGDLSRWRSSTARVTRRQRTRTQLSTQLDELRQDLLLAVRRIRRAPGFALAATGTLVLGIGACTALFSILQPLLIKPLPFAQPDRLVRVWSASQSMGLTEAWISVPDADDYARAASFQRFGTWSMVPSGLALTGSGEPIRLRTAFVGPGFFETLGVAPLLGRLFAPEEVRDGADGVVLLAWRTWKGRFGGDPAIVGRALRLNGRDLTVIGVMPRELRFPEEAEIWAPRTLIPESGIPRTRAVRWLSAVARLAPGVTAAQAQAELGAIAASLAKKDPGSSAAFTSAAVRPLHQVLVAGARSPLLVLGAAVILVLLIACVNVANLLLARGAAREREMAVRAALGAGRGRLVRQLLTESAVLALLGGLGGCALAAVSLDALLALAQRFLPRFAEPAVDKTALVFAFFASVAAGLLAGAVPALRAGQADLADALRGAGRSTEGVRGQRIKQLLVSVEVGLAVLLMSGAALALRSLWAIASVDPGYDTEHTVVARFSLRTGKDLQPSDYLERLRAIRDRVATVPGVLAAGMAKDLPLRGQGENYGYLVPGRPVPPAGQEPSAQMLPVSPGYFGAMGVRLVAGREIAEEDAAVVVLSEAIARREFPGEDPVGRALRLATGEARIVGVARDVRAERLDGPPTPMLYVPFRQMPRVVAALVVRTDRRPASMLGPVRDAIRSVDPTLPITELAEVAAVVSESVSAPRFLAVLLTIFGGVALLLSAIGLGGVVSFVVAQRSQEIGVRMALGAKASEVVRLMIWRGMAPALLGLGVGLAAAMAMGRLLSGMLYGVSPIDPLTLGSVAALLGAVGLLASWLPARRAAHVDPMLALRAD